MTFYFDVDIWGTVSDWLMVLVTTITAYYLYKTLQSQKDVQDIQAKLYEIETIRFRESIKPSFKFSIEKGTPKEGENISFFVIQISNESNNLALSITINSVDTKDIKRQFLFGKPKDFLKSGDEPINIYYTLENNSKITNVVIFELDYEDISGVKYKQSVECSLNQYFHFLKPNLARTKKQN